MHVHILLRQEYIHVDRQDRDTNICCLQRGPDYPRTHVHLPGDEQGPPFAQAGWQRARKGICNYTKSSICTHQKLTSCTQSCTFAHLYTQSHTHNVPIGSH